MLGRLLKNDILNHKLLSAATVIFMAASTLLMVLSIGLFTSLLGSVSGLMETAKTPDYLQMHSGTIDEIKLEEFAGSREEIAEWQICTFLNLDNSTIKLAGSSLEGNTQDNGLALQGESFDYLLDMENGMPSVGQGQVFVPVCYKSIYDLNIGDEMTIGNEKLTIAGFLRDSQMNSMMASSKRFLVCQEDYDRLKAKGSQEYLIEYLLAEDADLDAFGTDYGKAGLPNNGPAITKGLIKLMNALSDGIMILVIFLGGIAILLVSLLCLGFITSLGVERDKKEVGMLKALGFKNKSIRRIYMSKYLAFGGVSLAIGLAGGLALADPMGEALRQLYGGETLGGATLAASVIGALMVQLVILLYIRRIIKKNDKFTPLEAMQRERGQRKKSGRGQMVIISVVVAICMMLSIIPQNIYTTLSSPDFVTYMGIGKAQLRMDVRQSENIDMLTSQITEKLDNDEEVTNYITLKTVACQGTAKGKSFSLLVETGNHETFPVSYAEGRAPKGENEIALSVLQAEDLGVSLGDIIQFEREGSTEKATVCGLYSDITNGGKTAKMAHLPKLYAGEKPMWSVIYLSLKEGAIDQDQWAVSYKDMGADIVDIDQYVRATYGPTIKQVKMAKTLALAMAILIAFVVLVLFGRLLIEKERADISLKKAIGFESGSIRKGYIFKVGKPTAIGLILGLALASVLGQSLCGMALSSLGAAAFEFVVSVPAVAIITLVMVLANLLALWVATREVFNIKAYECLRGKE